MTQDSGYDLTPPSPPPSPPPPPPPPPPGTSSSPPKPGEPGFIPPAVIVEKAPPDPEIEGRDPDIEKNKGMAILGYICFLIPLIAAPNSRFARFHANQALLAFIYLIVAVIAVTVLNIGWRIVGGHVTIALLSIFFSCGINILSFALLLGWVVLVIMGIIAAANGERKPLPGLGHWPLIK